jgi:hypothetical protein
MGRHITRRTTRPPVNLRQLVFRLLIQAFVDSSDEVNILRQLVGVDEFSDSVATKF